MTYYGDSDPAAAAWLRELIRAGLIPPGDVDERDIRNVSADDVRGYSAVHFFAGIGGWPYALRLAGWPDDRPVWTGSCPCQPYSSAGRRAGDADPRNLWPEMLRLVRGCRPPVVFGEQVASAEVVGTQLEAAFVVAVRRGQYARANKLAKRLARSKSFHFHRRWVDGIRADLEAEGYAFGDAVLGAHSVGAPHIRQRLYWLADRAGEGRAAGRSGGAGDRRADEPGRLCLAGELADPLGERVRGRGPGGDGTAMAGMPGADGERQRVRADAGTSGGFVGVALGDTNGRPGAKRDERPARGVETPPGSDAQRSGLGAGIGAPDAGGLSNPPASGREGGQSELPPAGQAEGRLPAGPGDSCPWFPFDLIPCRDGKARRTQPGLFPLAHGIPGRVGMLRGYGNAIVPQVAATFVRAWLDCRR